MPTTAGCPAFACGVRHVGLQFASCVCPRNEFIQLTDPVTDLLQGSNTFIGFGQSGPIKIELASDRLKLQGNDQVITSLACTTKMLEFVHATTGQ